MKQIIRMLACTIVVAASVSIAAQPSPAMSNRVRTLVGALNAPAAEFEKFAQENFTPEYLSKQTPAQRRELVEQVQRELGRVEPGQLTREGANRIAIRLGGDKGKTARLVFEHEPETFRISLLELSRAEDDPDMPPPPPVRGSMSAAELSAALDAYLKRLAEEGRLSGTLLVSRDGKPLFEKAYNLANRAYSVPNSPATRFHLGSLNKDFTRVAIAQLAAAGKLTLADTLGQHLPDHPNASAKRATLEQLIQHTAGLGNMFNADYMQASKSRFRTNRDMYAFVAPMPLMFEPGSQEQYCNSCYVVLGEIVAKLSGMPYERYVERHVFEPAGMRSTGFFQHDEVRPNVATHYTETPNGLRSNVHISSAGGNAAGGAWSTVADLLAFENAARDGKLLDPKWTAWFFLEKAPAAGRVTASRAVAGGGPGINAAIVGNGAWTVIALSNFDQPFIENLAVALYRALTRA